MSCFTCRLRYPTKRARSPPSVQDHRRREGAPTILKLCLSTTDVYRRTLLGIRFGFPKDLVGDGGGVSFPE
jgi:hypothetical protein